MTDAAKMLGEALDHFERAGNDPGGDWAFTDDMSELCLDHLSGKGARFWININRNGTLSVLWRSPTSDEVQTVKFVAEREKDMNASTEPQDEWAIVEIMGMRKHAGRIMEVERFGAKMLRVDVPVLVPEQLSLLDRDKLATRMPSGAWVERWVTHIYGGGAIFGITPTDEQTVMAANRHEPPVGRYLPQREDDSYEPHDDDDRF